LQWEEKYIKVFLSVVAGVSSLYNSCADGLWCGKRRNAADVSVAQVQPGLYVLAAACFESSKES
jgi:hypothetical protein